METPRSILGCFDEDGKLDEWKLYRFHGHELDELILEELDSSDDEERPTKQRKKTIPSSQWKSGLPQKRLENGEFENMKPQETLWWILYVQNPKLDCEKFNKLFRNRFRMNYDSFQKLLKMAKDNESFQKWVDAKDAKGMESSPIELLLLGAQRYLGRGWTFDDLAENTAISSPVHMRFMKVYLAWGSTFLFKKFVTLPTSIEKLQDCCAEFDAAGCTGAMGSTDATHVGSYRLEARLANNHQSPKLPLPSRSYNTTVNHRRRILYTTEGHAARWNDKCIQRFDHLMTGLQSGSLYPNYRFKLLYRDEKGNVLEQEYKGPWLLVHNGYLKVGTCVPPLKHSVTHKESRFSRWLESMRKDIECTFGILKGRFRVLRTGVHLHGVDAVDKVYLTCCALHNFLLEEDGLDDSWDIALYLGDHGQHDEEDVLVHGNSHHSMEPTTAESLEVNEEDLHLPLQSIEGYETMMQDTDDTPAETVPILEIAVQKGVELDEVSVLEAPDVPTDTAIPVRTLKMDYFRGKLIEHFDILFQRNEIKWPSRTIPCPNLNEYIN